MFRSQDIQVFESLAITQFDGMMSITMYDMMHFLIYLSNHKSLTQQTWSNDRCKQREYFFETFWTI